MDFLCVCVRIPKSGSTSLANMLSAAFKGRRTFYIPHTIDLDGACSTFQRIRFARSRARNLFMRYRTTSIRKAFKIIAERADDGDLILGGHVDFPSVRKNVSRKVKMITLFREPAARCRSEYDYCREYHFKRGPLERIDSGLSQKMAAKYSFDGFLDFLLERRESYGNIAARYVGWDGKKSLDEFHAHNVFHSGILEQSGTFVHGLSEKMGRKLSLPCANRNPGDTAIAVTAEQRRKIEKIYPHDHALYEWQHGHA